jgi:RNA polymerase sigma-70 factor, ECF subfamily
LAASGTQFTSAATAHELTALVETYGSLLFRVARSVTRSSEEAEDVVQDCFVRVMEHRHDLPAIRDLRVWLVRITWNLALDRRRRLRPDQLDDLAAASLAARDLPADAALDETRRIRAALEAIDRLPAKEREVLLLAALEELSTAEIAAVLGKSESAVRALQFRARTRLRERLELRSREGGFR